MSSTILLKRSNTAGNDAYTGFLGEITLDTQARKLRIHDGALAGGHVVANMADVQDTIDRVENLQLSDIAGLEAALATIDGRLDQLETDVSTIQSTYIQKDGSVPFTGNINAGNNKIVNVSTPTEDTDAANKSYVDTEIASLGNAFSYEGTVAGGVDEANATDIRTLGGQTDTGSYYKVSTSGYVTDGTVTEFVNTGDGIIFNSSGSFDIVDNTNTEVQGTLNFIAVTGSTDTGFVVDLAQEVKDRITTLEGLDTGVSSVSGTSPITVDNTDSANPVIGIDAATQSSSGSMSASDKAKLDGVESGAQVNTVTSVAGKQGAVTLVKGDVGLSNVSNFSTADQVTATTGSSNNTFMTPEGVRYFIEDGTYTIDGGTF